MAIVQVGDERADVPPGSALSKVCTKHQLPVVFGCRTAQCGACLIRVLAGADNLEPPNEREEHVLNLVEAEPNWRLACQCVVLGDIHVRYV